MKLYKTTHLVSSAIFALFFSACGGLIDDVGSDQKQGIADDEHFAINLVQADDSVTIEITGDMIQFANLYLNEESAAFSTLSEAPFTTTLSTADLPPGEHRIRVVAGITLLDVVTRMTRYVEFDVDGTNSDEPTDPVEPVPEQPIDDPTNFTHFVDGQSVNGACSDEFTREENSFEQPWCTIQRAADVAQAGDEIRVEQGIYRETVEIKSSGTADNPIVFSGVRGADGEWLTIIDPSVATSGWEKALDIDPEGRVYKADLGFDPYELTSNGKRFDGKLKVGHVEQAFSSYTVWQILSFDSDFLVPSGYGEGAQFWDAFQAIYTYDNGVTYVRFRHGEDANTMNMRASPRSTGIAIRDQSYVTINNLSVRGVHVGARLEGSAAQHNVIENSHFPHGMQRITIGNLASHNHIRDNLIESQRVSNFKPGAWISCSRTPFGSTTEGVLECATRAHFYQGSKGLFKYGHAFTSTGRNWAQNEGSGSGDGGISLSPELLGDPGAGEDNRIYDNIIRNFNSGIAVGALGGLETGRTLIYRNTIENSSSVAVVINANTHSQVWSNAFINTNMALRTMKIGGPTRTLYFFNNIYRGHGPGRLAFFHVGNCTNGVNPDSQFWFYHNSIHNVSQAFTSTCRDETPSIAGLHIINNVSSTHIGSFLHNEIGSFSYNWHRYPSSLPAGASDNIYGNKVAMWDESDNGQDLALPADSAARSAGIDLSKTFTINGTTHSALPGMQPVYFTGSAPHMGAIQD